MRYLLLTWLLILVLATTGAAQHFYYLPNAMVSPVLKQKGNTGAGVFIGRGSDFQGWEAQGYYALSNRLVMTGGYLDSGKKAVVQNLQQGTKYRFGEIGVGVYEPLRKGSASFVAGYGRGYLYNFYSAEEASEFNISRWFLKSNLTYREGYFQGGFDIRLSYLRYENGIVPINLSANELYTISLLEKSGSFFLPEFGVHAGVRFKPVFLGIAISGIYRRTLDLGFARVNSSIKVMVEFGGNE